MVNYGKAYLAGIGSKFYTYENHLYDGIFLSAHINHTAVSLPLPTNFIVTSYHPIALNLIKKALINCSAHGNHADVCQVQLTVTYVQVAVSQSLLPEFLVHLICIVKL